MSWAHYMLQVNIYLVVFYGFYKLLLDKETYFTLNRIYLVSASLLSLAIPFLRFDWFSRQEVVQPVYISVGQLMGQVSIIQDSNSFSAGNLIVLIYFIGTLFFALRFMFQLRALTKKLKHHESGDAFSFFRKKRIDKNLPQYETVHRHEDTHVRQWHSADIIFFEVLSIFTWFNPIVYFYKKAVKSIHEYLADDEAAKFQGDKNEYSLLLLSRAFAVPVNTLTNSFFNKSLIKRRIFMLHKQRSPKVAILKYGLFIPLFATALIMSSATLRNNDKIKEITRTIPLNAPLQVVNEVVTASIEPTTPEVFKATTANTKTKPSKAPSSSSQEQDPVHDFVSIDKQPNFPGGMSKFYEYLKNNIKYPAEAVKNKVNGHVFLSFIVEKDGTLNNIKVERKLGSGTDEEAVRVLEASPKWIPGMLKDKPVRVKYNIPISFKTTNSQTVPGQQQNSNSAPTENTKGIHFGDTNGGKIKLGEHPEKEPLVIIDGVPGNMADMRALPTENIESVSVLKNANATAIYGVKGVNGVILIVTKTHKATEKTPEIKEKKE